MLLKEPLIWNRDLRDTALVNDLVDMSKIFLQRPKGHKFIKDNIGDNNDNKFQEK